MRSNLNLSSNKKGNAIVETIMVMVVIFIFGILTVIGFKINDDLYPEMTDNTTMSPEAIEVAETIHTGYPKWFDGGFLLMFILLYIFVLTSAWFVDTHPLFFIFTILLLVFVLIVGAVLTNSWEEIIGDGDFGAVSASFPIMSFILSHLVETVLAIGASIAFVLYGKSSGGGF